MATMTDDPRCDLLPEIDDRNRAFWDGCRDGELRLQRCDTDGTFRYPYSPVCPACLSPHYSWATVSGEATLWSWVVLHQKYFAAVADRVPYLVSFVQLREGPFMISSLSGDVTQLRCGQPLTVGFEAIDNERSIPVFAVAKK
jgi:uncharacterized OB-fold protein